MKYVNIQNARIYCSDTRTEILPGYYMSYDRLEAELDNVLSTTRAGFGIRLSDHEKDCINKLLELDRFTSEFDLSSLEPKTGTKKKTEKKPEPNIPDDVPGGKKFIESHEAKADKSDDKFKDARPMSIDDMLEQNKRSRVVEETPRKTEKKQKKSKR